MEGARDFVIISTTSPRFEKSCKEHTAKTLSLPIKHLSTHFADAYSSPQHSYSASPPFPLSPILPSPALPLQLAPSRYPINHFPFPCILALMLPTSSRVKASFASSLVHGRKWLEMTRQLNIPLELFLEGSARWIPTT